MYVLRLQGMRASLAALLLLGGLASSELYPAATVARYNTDKDNFRPSNKTLEFVNIIKDDLQRNNDDYVAGGGQEQRHQIPARARAPLPHAPKHELPRITIDTRRTLNVTENQTTTASNTTLFRSYSEEPAVLKKLRIDKLKRLIDKGKTRLRELMQAAKNDQNGKNSHNGLNGKNGHNGKNLHNGKNGENGEMEDGVLSRTTRLINGKPIVTPEGAPDKNKALRGPPLGPRTSPSPNQIDMAPARGANVHTLRLKGRLCQRNLLNPEGPKYDSKGSTIMPPHAPEIAHGREFPQTRVPPIVLPRCCNCCKKSVLGCQ